MKDAGELTIYGRRDSSAVARVMWTVGELDLPHRRVDWGGAHGGNDDPAYRRLNPSGRIPALVLPSGDALWESNAIIRCLANLYGAGSLTSSDPVERSQAEAWMDYSAAVGEAVGAVRRGYKAWAPDPGRLAAAIGQAGRTLGVLEARLGAARYLGGERFGIADLANGVWVHRWFRCPSELPELPILPRLRAWYDGLCARPAYRTHVMEVVSAGPQRMGGSA